MNRRLLQFLGAENITQSQLAETLDVAKASVSNILAGRNRPGYDFIESLMLHYPDLNIEWLITGRGKMYKSSVQPSVLPDEGPIFTAQASQQDESFPETEPSFEIDTQSKDVKAPVNQRRITGICVFFDDGTFQDIRV